MKTQLTSFWFALFALASIGVSSAVTVLNDGFEIGTHAEGFRTQFVPASGGSAYYGSGTSSASLINDATFGSKALNVTASTGYQIISPLGGSISLATIGETLTLSFKFRFTNSPTADSGAFRFGFHSSMGTPVTSDVFGTTVADNDTGYYMLVGANTAQTGLSTGTAVVYAENGGTTSILSGGDREGLVTGTTGPSIATGNNASHNISLTATRTNATTITISYIYDGGATVTATTTNLKTNFDQIAFSNGFTGTLAQYAIDDVQLTASNFTPIPEPSIAGLAGLGLLSLLKRRR